MKKAVVIFVLGLALCASAQNWDARLTIDPNPSPYLSDWQTDPTLASVEIHNYTNNPEVVEVFLEISNSQGQIGFRGKSQRLLVHPGSPEILDPTGFQSWYTEEINDDLQQKAIRTGMLPEDDMYEVCIEVRDLWGTTLVQQTCAFFSIRHPEPPELIYPIDYEVIQTPYPIFQWIPPQITTGKQLIYVFRLVELLPNQTPDMALAANYPHYENFNLFNSDFEYPLDAQPLESNKTYVWQVQALDFEGKPATKNDGKSIIGVFSTDEILDETLPQLTLIAPQPDALVETPAPVFEWMEPIIALQGPIYYTLRIVEMQSGQTPETAILQNPVFYINSATITESGFTYPGYAEPFVPNNQYAWQVEALDQFGQPVTLDEGKSEVWSFVYTGTETGPVVDHPFLPERLPLPDEQIAWLTLKKEGSALVDYAFSADSSQLTISSQAVPLNLPILADASGSAPVVEAQVDLTFDRFTLDITSGRLSAAPRLPFDLRQVGIPAVVRQLNYIPELRQFALSAEPALFGQTFSEYTLQLDLTEEGKITAGIPSQSGNVRIPLAANSDRLVYQIESLQGNIDADLFAQSASNQLNLSGALVFLPNWPKADERTYPCNLAMENNQVMISSQGFPNESRTILLPMGSFQLGLDELYCKALSFSGPDNSWDFDLVFDLQFTFTDFLPEIELPAQQQVHLTPDGFELPQISIADLGFEDYYAYQTVQIQPWAFRMQATTFDWFSWDGQLNQDWGFYFDFGVKLSSLPPRLQGLKQTIDKKPLIVTNAQYTQGIFVGSVSNRQFQSVTKMPLSENGKWTLIASEIRGEFSKENEQQAIRLWLDADLLPPIGSPVPEDPNAETLQIDPVDQNIDLQPNTDPSPANLQLQGSSATLDPSQLTQDIQIYTDDTSPGQAIDLGDSLLQMTTTGLVSGESEPVTDPIPFLWETLEVQSNSSVFTFSYQSTQSADVKIDGHIDLPLFTETTVRATGSGLYDMIAESFKEADFLISDPFKLPLPLFSDQPTLVLGCSRGASITADGLILPDGQDVLHLDNSTIPLTYQNTVRFDLPDGRLADGSISFADPFAFSIAQLSNSGSELKWKAVAQNSTPDSLYDNLILQLPQAPIIQNGELPVTGEAQAHIQLNGVLYKNLNVTYSNDFSLAFDPVRVKSGRIDFYHSQEQVAHLDASGFWPGDFFTQEQIALAHIPLPDSTIAYLDISDSSAVAVVPENDLLRITTKSNQTATLVFPVLGYGTTPAPSTDVVLDITVNASTLRMVQGSISVQASPGEAIWNLNDRAMPIKITKLHYAERQDGYSWTADVKPVMPAALQNTALVVRDVAIDVNGLNHWDTGYSSSQQSATTSDSILSINKNVSISFDGWKMDLPGQKELVSISGDLWIDFFTPSDSPDPEPLHFTSILTADSMHFFVSSSKLVNQTIPLGCGELELLQPYGKPVLSIFAPMNKMHFSVQIYQALLKFSGLSPDFALTVENIQILPTGLSVSEQSTDADSQQVTTLFGCPATISSLRFTATANRNINAYLTGKLELWGKAIDFTELCISSSCNIDDQQLFSDSFYIADSLIRIGSIKTLNNYLHIKGGLYAPDPFKTFQNSPFTLQVNAGGDWLDEQGQVMAIKEIHSVEQEQSDPVLTFGQDPLTVNCKLAGLSLMMYGDQEKVDASLILTINSYWPSPLEDQNVLMPINGTVRIDQDSTAETSWTFAAAEVPGIDLAGLLNMTIETPTIPADSPFRFSLSGSVSLQLPGAGTDQGGGCNFTDFILGPDTFEFGRIYEGSFDLFGMSVQVDSFYYGFDLRNIETYDVSFEEDNASGTATSRSHDGFYLAFAGRLDGGLTGFSGGIDQLWVYKSDTEFNLLIDNANFRYGTFSTTFASGRLDLIADIPLGGSSSNFRFLIGGSLTAMGTGFAAVGELSYRQVEYGGTTMSMPGFGLFLAAMGMDIKLTPIPITIEDFGAGLFFNPSPEVESIVRGNLGFTNDTENSQFFDAVNEYKKEFENVMTFLEFYVYGKLSVPDDAIFTGKTLLMIATDKFRLDAAAMISGSKDFKSYVDISSSWFIEIGVPQDFSSYPYAAGNITITVAPGNPESLKFIDMSEIASATAMLEFYAVDIDAWAVHGSLDINLFRLLDANFEFFIGPPAFLVRGSVARSFNAIVVNIEVGMQACVWFKWADPMEWGAYGSAWVEANVLADWFAGVRGELGAALMGNTGTFYLYGYAQLEAYFLGIRSTLYVWVEWNDGEISGGTGEDERMAQIIQHAEEIADEILGSADNVQRQIDQAARDAFAELTPAQIANIINNLQQGQDQFYLKVIEQDARIVLEELERLRSTTNSSEYKAQYQRQKEALAIYRDELQVAFAEEKITELLSSLDDWENAIDEIKSDFDGKIAQYEQAFARLITVLNASGFETDTVIINMERRQIPQDPITKETKSSADGSVQLFSIDGEIAEKNSTEIEQSQQDFEQYFDQITSRTRQLDSLRTYIYTSFGPNSEISQLQADFVDPLIRNEVLGQELLQKTSNLYQFYLQKQESLIDKWTYDTPGGIGYLRNAFIASRNFNESFIQEAFDRRKEALESLSGIDIPFDPATLSDQSIASDELAEHFYRNIPLAFLEFTLDRLDSLYNEMAYAHTAAFEARNDVHRTFTAHTDLVWNKYAELSQSLYGLYEQILNYADMMEQRNEPLPVEIENIRTKYNQLGDEFSMTGATTFQGDLVTHAGVFMPATLELGWDEHSEIIEYSFSHSTEGENRGYQAVGKQNQFDLNYFMPIRSSDALYRDYKIKTRVRNYAGYTATTHNLDFRLSYHNPRTGVDLSSLQTETNTSPYMWGAITFPEGKPSATVFHNNTVDEYYYQFDSNNVTFEFEINDLLDENAENQYIRMEAAIFTADDSKNPLVDYTAVPAVSPVTLRDLNLQANSENGYIIKMRGINGDGSADNFVPSPVFFIDQTPPGFKEPLSASFELSYNDKRVYVKCKKAREWFSSPNRKAYCDIIYDLAAYQYKVYYDDEDPEQIAWKTIVDSELPYHWGGGVLNDIDMLVLNAGSYPMRDSCKLAIRAQNPDNNLGWGPVSVISVPKHQDLTLPTPAEFQVIDHNDQNEIRVEIRVPAYDNESEISGYQYEISDFWDHQNIIRAYPDNVRIFDFPADSVNTGKILALPLERDIDELRALWLCISLKAINKDGLSIQANEYYAIAPPKPELEAALIPVDPTSVPERYEPPFTYGFVLSTPETVEYFTCDLRVGSTPGAKDLGHGPFLFGPESMFHIENTTRLPNRIGYDDTVYVSARSVSRDLNGKRFSSDSVMVQLITPAPPMFSQVQQNDDGYLTIPIEHEAFNGHHRAIYQYQIRDASSGSGALLRPFPASDQADFSMEEVTSGDTLVLPVHIDQCTGLVEMGLRAFGPDEMVQTNYALYKIVPDIPQTSANIEWVKALSEYRLHYETDIFNKTYMNGSASVALMAGSEPGTSDIKQPFMYYKGSQDFVSLPIEISHNSTVYLTSWARTLTNKTSKRDTIAVEVPGSPIFNTVVLDNQGYLNLKIVTTGFADDKTPVGYQYAVSVNTKPPTPVRPWPQSGYDFEPESVIPGDFLKLETNVDELSLREGHLVWLRGFSADGDTTTTRQFYMSLPTIPLNARFIEGSDGYILRFKGVYDGAGRFGGNLNMQVRLGSGMDEADILSDSFIIPGDGRYLVDYTLGGSVQVGQNYYLSAYYELDGERSGTFRKVLTPPALPMFTQINQPDEQTVQLPILRGGFNNSDDVAGYQYAVGSDSGLYDVRPFPQAASFDLTAAEVQAGTTVDLPIATRGLPQVTWIALKAINNDGVESITRESFYPVPPTPVSDLIEIVQTNSVYNYYLKFDVKHESVDAKVGHIWIEAFHSGSKSSIIREGRYGWPTWYFGYYYSTPPADRTFNCPVNRYLFIDHWYVVQIWSKDRWNDVSSLDKYKIWFKIDEDYNLTISKQSPNSSSD
ncbi:hypothetical protein GF407_16090 [candidate division KSB1 bacterium]|nr:hypothetical protein [candidate division KSB1 bacterium]